MNSVLSDGTGQNAGPRRQIKAASSNEMRARRLGLVLATPALVYIVVFLLFPLIYNLYLSITDANGGNLIYEIQQFS